MHHGEGLGVSAALPFDGDEDEFEAADDVEMTAAEQREADRHSAGRQWFDHLRGVLSAAVESKGERR